MGTDRLFSSSYLFSFLLLFLEMVRLAKARKVAKRVSVQRSLRNGGSAKANVSPPDSRYCNVDMLALQEVEGVIGAFLTTLGEPVPFDARVPLAVLTGKTLSMQERVLEMLQRVAMSQESIAESQERMLESQLRVEEMYLGTSSADETGSERGRAGEDDDACDDDDEDRKEGYVPGMYAGLQLMPVRRSRGSDSTNSYSDDEVGDEEEEDNTQQSGDSSSSNRGDGGSADRRRSRAFWSKEETDALRAAIREEGMGNWKRCAEWGKRQVPRELVGRSNLDIRNKAREWVKGVDY
jgi:hypothetical protein